MNKADLAPGKLAECLIAKTGQYVAWPGDIAVIGLYYRDDLLNSAGVMLPEDWTWEEFIETGKKIKQDTGAFSMTISTAGGDATALPWTILAMQLGGSVTNADGTEVTLDNDAGIAAMALLKQIYDAGIHIDEVLSTRRISPPSPVARSRSHHFRSGTGGSAWNRR